MVPRSLGGCDQPNCVAALGHRCHRAWDHGELDLVSFPEPRSPAELAQRVAHLGLFRLLRCRDGHALGAHGRPRWFPQVTATLVFT
jgi:hypothetical protein